MAGRSRRPKRASASEDIIRAVSQVLTSITENLSGEERHLFARELLDALSLGKAKDVHKVLSAWLVTVTIRKHPDFARQTKEFGNLVESGELHEGVDLTTLRSS